MKLPKNILLSDFFHLKVRCDQGIDHGSGFMVWMHPPVHRVLGWMTKPSALNLSRNVWRLNQLKAITNEYIYVKGQQSISDQLTLDRFPTLINANLINKNGKKIASIIDLVFDSISGKILYYLVSRSNPKIPGSSRWSLQINQIKDQQPGMILSDLNTLSDLPLLNASVKEELINKTKNWRNQIQNITNQATVKLEGWLDESPWQDTPNTQDEFITSSTNDWIDNYDNESNVVYDKLENNNQYHKRKNNDPWI